MNVLGTGWNGPSALGKEFYCHDLGRCLRLAWQRAFGPPGREPWEGAIACAL